MKIFLQKIQEPMINIWHALYSPLRIKSNYPILLLLIFIKKKVNKNNIMIFNKQYNNNIE